MIERSNRLSALTGEELARLQTNADELAQLQQILNRLPLGLQVETLSDKELQRLQEIARAPMQELCGAGLLTWNNMCRTRVGLKARS